MCWLARWVQVLNKIKENENQPIIVLVRLMDFKVKRKKKIRAQEKFKEGFDHLVEVTIWTYTEVDLIQNLVYFSCKLSWGRWRTWSWLGWKMLSMLIRHWKLPLLNPNRTSTRSKHKPLFFSTHAQIEEPYEEESFQSQMWINFKSYLEALCQGTELVVCLLLSTKYTPH